MNWWKIIICLFKGHDVDPEESIVKDVVIDKRNWICRCHRDSTLTTLDQMAKSTDLS